MIFVSVGTQFPFDRLVRDVDEWAARRSVDIVAQIAAGRYLPQRARWRRFMSSEDFDALVRAATVLVSHAGVGSIITAREHGKPIIVVNREHARGEHRNDHQGDGLEWMSRLPGVYPATTREALHRLLDEHERLRGPDDASAPERRQLSEFIGEAIRAR